jgi:holo-ACP synthase CitX
MRRSSNITLEELLAARDDRYEYQKQLLKGGQCLVCLTMNIPGNRKRSPLIDKAFEYGVNLLEIALLANDVSITEKHIRTLKTGCEGFWVVDFDPTILKQEMVDLENSCEIGRVFDIDIITEKGIVARSHLGASPRKCYVCNENAHQCARSQSHSYDELVQHIDSLLSKFFEKTK